MKIYFIVLMLFTVFGCSFTQEKIKTLSELFPRDETKTEVIIPVVTPVITPDPVVVDNDIEIISKLVWVDIADGGVNQCEHGSIVKTYTGYVINPFAILAQLPNDFTCFLDNSGVHITIPKSDETGTMAALGTDGRRAFVCVFDIDGFLLKVEDWSDSTYLDNRWKDKPVAMGLVIHCKSGQAISRSNLYRVKD